MAAATEVRAGGAYVELTARDMATKVIEGVGTAMQNLGMRVVLMGAMLAGVGAAITAPLLDGLNVASQWANELVSGSRRTGIAMDQLGGLAYALGTDMDGLSVATSHMDTILQQAANGSQEANQHLRQLGLTMAELNGMTQPERIRAFADALNRIEDPGQRIAMQRQIFGRQGASLNIAGGASGIQQREGRGQQLGANMSQADIATLREYNAATRDLGIVTRATWTSIGAAIAPTVTATVRVITEIISTVKGWIDANRPLIDTVYRIGSALVIAGGVLGFIGAGMIAAGVAAGYMAVPLAAAATVVTTLGGIVPITAFAFGALAAVAKLVAGGFGLMTAMGVAYSVGQWAVNATVAAASLLVNAFSFSEVGAAITTAILSGGLYVLVAALGAVVIVAGAAVAAFAGFAAIAGIAFAVQRLGIEFGRLHPALSVVDDLIQGIVDTAKHVWDWIVDSPIGDFVGLVRSAWATVQGAFSSVMQFFDDTGVSEFLGKIRDVALGFVGVTIAAAGFAGYAAYVGIQWLTTAGNIERAWAFVSGMFGGMIGNVRLMTSMLVGIGNASIGPAFGPIIEIGRTVRSLGPLAMETAGRMYDAFAGAAGRIVGSFGDAFSRTFSAIGQMFTTLIGTATQAWGGIMDAFGAGDMELVFEILKTSAMIAWNEIRLFGMTSFNAWKDALTDSMFAAWDAIRIAFAEGWGFIKAGWFTIAASVIRALIPVQAALVALLDAASALPGEAGENAARASMRVGGTNLEARAADADRAGRDATGEGRETVARIQNESLTRQAQAEATRASRDEALRQGHDEEAARLQQDLDIAEQQALVQRIARDEENARNRQQTEQGRRGFEGAAKEAKIQGTFSARAVAGFAGNRGQMDGVEQIGRDQARTLNLILDELRRRAPAPVMG